MMLDQRVHDARELGAVLARHLEGRNAVIVASNDMTHFESAQQAMLQDRLLARRMEELDPEGLITERDRHRISACGAGPVAAMLYAAVGLGATQARTVAYSNSGETTGSDREVVGYLALAVRR
jgi:AmmeMemoRadiSam system protein B